MNWVAVKLRIHALLHRRQFERDIQDELALHLSLRDRKRFGNPTRIAEDLREMRAWTSAENLWQDLRYALRQLRRNPGFALGAIVPLALAIGCIAAVLTLADAVLFRPTGIRDPGRVAAVYTFSRTQNRYLSDSYPDFRDIRALPDLTDSVAAYIRGAFSVRFAAGAERMTAEMVSGDYFRAAGVTPVLGRPLTPDDDSPAAPPVTLISDSLWETRYARSPSVLGSMIWINRVPFTIVGVMPRGYQGMLLDWYKDCSLWVPLTHFNRFFPTNTVPDYEHRRDIPMFMLLARLRPGVSVARYQAALDVLAARIAARPDLRYVALPSGEARFFPAYRAGTLRFLWMLLLVSAAAVAIACFNLANLLLARIASRRREIAARMALGAGRGRVIQQLVVENAALALCACAFSIPVAITAAQWLRDAPITAGISLGLDVSPDWRALALGMAAGLATAIAAGVVPALKASRAGLRPSQARRTHSRDFLLAAQVACAMTILVPAALLAENLRDLGHAQLGYDPRGVLLASTADDQLYPLAPALLTALRSQVPEAALASTALPTVMRSSLDVSADSRTSKPVSYNWVSGGYFDLLRIPILSGRAILDSDDRHSQPVAVVNQSAASLLWPGENPVGHRLQVRGESQDREVIGVVEDIRARPLGSPAAPEPYLFLPLLQRASPSYFEIYVRTPGPPLQFAGTLRQILARIAPDAALADVRTLTSQIDDGLKPMHLAAQATGAVSLLGILLAIAGMFAACAFRVTEQRKAIAIRIAIGAEPRRVIRSYILRAAWIGIAGVCAGLVPASWAARLLRASIAGTTDPGAAVYAFAGLVLAAASAMAAFAAARRIARLHPSDILRIQ